jgi:hypothetical protein
VEAHRQEQRQRQDHPADRRHPGEDSEEGADPHGQLGQGDDHPDRHRAVLEMGDERVEGTQPGGRSQLGLNRAGLRRVEEPGVGELLGAGERKGEPEERSQGQHDPSGALTRVG